MIAENGLVSGLKIDFSADEPTFGESCVYAKATRKPMVKKQIGQRAKEFVEEVHTDVWGPRPFKPSVAVVIISASHQSDLHSFPPPEKRSIM